MDLSTLLAGARAIRPCEVEKFAERKHVALESAYFALADEIGEMTFDDFVAKVPPSVLNTYFASDGIDQHYTRLFGGLAMGEQDFDAFLAVTINFILGELTYQGRYLSKYEPEALVVSGGGAFALGVALANVEKIESFKVGVYDEPDSGLTARMQLLALNSRPLVWGAPDILAGVVRTALGRPLGCMAMLDIGLPTQSAVPYREALEPLLPYLTPDTFHLFAGDTVAIFRLRVALHAQFPEINILHRAYAVQIDGAEVNRSVMVVTGLNGIPDLDFGTDEEHFRWYPNGSDAAMATGLSRIEIRPAEEVPLRLPAVAISSGPLSDRQIQTISTPLHLGHTATRLEKGRVIHAQTIFAATYVIATSDRQIFEHLHIPELIFNTPYGKPDSDSTISVPIKPMAIVQGAALLFSFSPVIVSYHSHFLLQCFPLVISAEMLAVPDLRLLVPSGMRGYQLRMLEMVGWGADRLVVMNPDYDYVCDTLYVPTIPPAIFSPFQSTVYDRLIEQVPAVPVNPKKRIILSRAARTTWRNMVNYDAVCDLLIRDCGFELVAPEKLSIEDEIQLFQSSAIVVGAEGAGLYNCCFMAPGTDVVVLADQDYVMYVVGSMAEIRDFDLSFVFGESFQADRDLTRRAGHADFVLDPLRVRSVVEQIISKKHLDEPVN